MCGIVSVISKKQFGFVYKDTTIFQQLLFADTLRGEDSTGVFSVTKFGDFYVNKSAEEAVNFLTKYTVTEAWKETQNNGIVLVGHNRKGTMGTIRDDTAHPFVVNDDFVLVHNGTLSNHRTLKQTEVDSEALAYHIEACLRNVNYDINLLGEAFNAVWGAYALVWYDQRTHKVQFMRNSQRPLWIAEGKDSWFLCSEGGLLHWILSRNGVEYKDLKPIEENKLYSLSPGTDKPMEVEALPEKKSNPTVTTTVAVGSTTLGTIQFSKNQQKRLNRKYVGSRIEFFITDQVERFPFNGPTEDDSYYVLGETDALGNIEHTVRGLISLSELGLKDILEVEDYLFTGEITHFQRDVTAKEFIVTVKDIRICPPSTVLKLTHSNENPTAIH